MTSGVKENPTERLRCKATRKDGKPCRGWAQADGYCVGHSPKAEDWRRKGGKNSSKIARADKLLPLRLRPILELLERALTEVYGGELDLRRGTAMASIANAIIKAYESGVMEERLAILENRLSDGGLK
jgi:hypothetical protein